MHHVVYVSLLLLPAEAQSWFCSLDRASVQWFGRYASSYLSPSLIRYETASLQSLQGHESVKIKTLQQGRHIVVVFTKDEIELDLEIRLPENYPLRAVEVNFHLHFTDGCMFSAIYSLVECVTAQSWCTNLAHPFHKPQFFQRSHLVALSALLTDFQSLYPLHVFLKLLFLSLIVNIQNRFRELSKIDSCFSRDSNLTSH